MENNELYHHGTKGMQWGKRLYQNKDGSLTALGRARYGTKSNMTAERRKATIAAKKKAAEAEAKKAAKAAEKAKNASKTKKVSDMSDAELTSAINRARMEDTYKSLRPEETSKVKSFTKTIFDNVIAPAATNAGKSFLENALKRYGDSVLDKAFKDAVDPDSISELKKTKEKLELKDAIDKLKNPRPKEETWDDKTKKQAYEANERKQKLVDLQNEFAYEKKKAEYDTWKRKQAESNQRVNDINDSDTSTGRDFVAGLLSAPKED